MGYEPLLIKEVPDSHHHDLRQKVIAVGSIARFIVIDDSHPSGHLTELEVCRINSWITLVMREEGRHSSWMAAGISHSSNVILEKEYEAAFPQEALQQGIQWAENKVQEIKDKYEKTYPWRSVSVNK
jgi:hypothetical protein